jgi:hypothetical protein
MNRIFLYALVLTNLLTQTSFAADLVSIKKFNVFEGEYLSENCFLKVSNIGDRIHIQFAHKDFLLSDQEDRYSTIGHENSDIVILGDVYNSDLAFTPENIPGINIIIDAKTNRVEFGPSLCNESNRLKTNINRNSLSINCGSRLSRINVSFKMNTDLNNNLKQFKFVEKYNSSRRFFLLAPWYQKERFDFICSDLTLKPL